MIGIFFFWLALSIIVGIAANTRGRNPVSWFFLSVLLSPVIAGLLLLALPGKGLNFAANDAELWRNINGDEYQPQESKFVGLFIALIICAIFIVAYVLS